MHDYGNIPFLFSFLRVLGRVPVEQSKVLWLSGELERSGRKNIRAAYTVLALAPGRCLSPAAFLALQVSFLS